MNREDIIRLAREAGFDAHDMSDDFTCNLKNIERFAALVISHHVKETRPEVSDSMATWLQQIAYQHGGIGDLSSTEMEFGAMVAAAEREACAKVCDDEATIEGVAQRCADAIRARSNV